jgi:outer membrane protein assembly factor BamB
MNGSNLWKTGTGGPVEAPPLFLDGTVYVGSDDGSLYALSGETGRVMWTYKTQARITGSANWATLSNGTRLIVVGSYDGKLHAVDALSGVEAWTCVTGGYINGTPAVADGLILFGGCDMTVRMLDVGSGRTVRTIEMGSYIPTGPAVAGGRLYVGHFGGDFVCADIYTAKLIWKAEEQVGPVVTYPALAPQRVVYGARDMKVHCLDRTQGASAWTYTAGGDVDSSPVVAGDRVVFGADDGRLRVLNLADGVEVWSYEIGHAIKSSPAVANGVVVIGADDGSIYAFGSASGLHSSRPQPSSLR